jgi:hypothetical protein
MTPDPLDPLLDRWNVPPTAPLRLSSEVWRRIDAGERRPAAEGSLLERLEAVFRRPSFAAMLVIACMLAGLFLAEFRLTRLHAERGAQYARSYLHLIDPLLSAAQEAPPVVNASPGKERAS